MDLSVRVSKNEKNSKEFSPNLEILIILFSIGKTKIDIRFPKFMNTKYWNSNFKPAKFSIIHKLSDTEKVYRILLFT